MVKAEKLLELSDYERLTDIFTYLLAGLEGHTDGNHLISVTVQQAGVSGFRVVLRAFGRDAAGVKLRVVAFTSASNPGAALLIAEDGYRDNLIRWHVDKFAKSVGDNGSTENEVAGLSITE